MPYMSHKPKVVAALLVGGLGLGALSFSQATLTSAALTDTAMATSQNLSTGNVLPPSTQAWCTDTGDLGGLHYGVNLSVSHINPAFDYVLNVIEVQGKVNYTQEKPGSGVLVGGRVEFSTVTDSQLGGHTRWDYQARIYSKNRATGELSDSWIGYNLFQPTIWNIDCKSATSGGQTPGVLNVAQPASERGQFVSLLEEIGNEGILEPLPGETGLADLDAAARPGPTPTDEAKPTESKTSTTAPSPTSSSDEAAPDTESEGGGKSEASSSTIAVPSTPAATTSGITKPGATGTPSQAVPTTAKTMVSTTRTTTVDAQPGTAPPASTTTKTSSPPRAGVGDEPINVGYVLARLDDVDGQPRLVITSGGGSEVCTADVPGATRITSNAGKLTVTVGGSTRRVNLTTCETN